MKSHQSSSDKELLEAYCAGNQNAISQLLERYQRRLYDYIFMMVKEADLADDIYQETTIKAVKVIDEGRYADNGKFLSWVMRIAHNQVIDHFRAQKQQRVTTESEAGYDILGTKVHLEGSVEDRLVGEQIQADVRKLIERLPDEQREVVKMRYYADMSFKEIAEQTQVSINTALGRMRYALINLRKMIKDNDMVLS